MARRRLDAKQAAQVLGISTDAVHKRVRRGTLEADKDPDGEVFVYLDDNLDDGYTPDRRDAHIASLEEQIDFLRRELERKDTIIMTIPAHPRARARLRAPRIPRDSLRA